ncbi:VOC family protein [Streptomyces sp. CRN 30]|uniref:VOC family protein n=1 Tax=Streptomyces sp. CRN 30 TaxID=3075613 RepID=UPI002A835A26|nr:VOC family protein [Streptomyces sp. CRN 30]
MYQQMIFVNLAVSDLDASKKFFTELGYTINPQFSDDNCASVVISDTIVAMLLTRQRYAEFTKKELVDATKTSEVLLCLSAESREKVDELCDKAIAAGGTSAGDPQDYGTMYGRSFDDLDGHTWEVMWMDPAAVQG